MSGTRVEVSSVIPSTISMKTLSNRNNYAGICLQKQMTQVNRQRSFVRASLDREKLDTFEFLKQVQHCDSDFHPSSKTYLGRDISKSSATLRQKFRRTKSNTTLGLSASQTDEEEGAENENERAVTHSSVEMINLDTRRPMYMRLPATGHAPARREYTTVSEGCQERNVRLRGGAQMERKCNNDSKKPKDEKIKAFFAWLKEKREAGEKFTCRNFEKPDKLRREEFKSWLRARSEMKARIKEAMQAREQAESVKINSSEMDKESTKSVPKRKHFIAWSSQQQKSPSPQTDRFESSVSNHSIAVSEKTTPASPVKYDKFVGVGGIMPVIANLKTKFKREPFENRLSRFYNKIDILKAEEVSVIPLRWGDRRRW